MLPEARKRKARVGQFNCLGLLPFLRRLSDAFGWRYVAAVVLTYGGNQGIGETLVFYARSYYLLDEVGMKSATYGQLAGFSHIPWQLKSLFGLLSDTVPINGLHRAPYMLVAGILGVIATMLLTVVPTGMMTYQMGAMLFLLVNVNFALPDVMIDATVAERCKSRPDLAAELQALCWGSISLIGIAPSIARGYLLNAGGPHLLFSLSIGSAFCVVIPPLLGWLAERRRPAPVGRCPRAQIICDEVCDHHTRGHTPEGTGVPYRLPICLSSCPSDRDPTGIPHAAAQQLMTAA